MRTGIILSAIGALLLIGIAIITGKPGSGLPGSNGQNEVQMNTSSQQYSHEALLPPKSSKRHRASTASLGDLRRAGYVISGDRIGRNSVEGNVDMLGPDGTAYSADSLKLTAGGDEIILIGRIRIEKDGNVAASENEEAYVRISIANGKTTALQNGPWQLWSAVTPNKAE